jgi:hypothetical protein
MEYDNNSDASSESSDGESFKGTNVFPWLTEDKSNASGGGGAGLSSRTMAYLSRMRLTADTAPRNLSDGNQNEKFNIFKFQVLLVSTHQIANMYFLIFAILANNVVANSA